MDKEKKRRREKETVAMMIGLYCHHMHHTKDELCPECAALRDYAWQRSDHCPFMAEKTFCSNCRVHCYEPKMREQIRAVMRYAGPRMPWHHPFMALQHLWATKREKRRLQRETQV